MKIIHKIETYTSDGKPVLRFTVMNSSGAYMEFTNWGARWITASVPDVQGALANILIGYDTLSDYLKDSYYMGATVGRFANRIADASFTIDRKTFHLEVNDGNNTNHGGFPAFITRCGNGKNYRMASVLVCIRQTEKEVPGKYPCDNRLSFQ